MTTMVEYGLPTTGFPPPRGPIPDDACPACKHSLADQSEPEKGSAWPRRALIKCSHRTCGCREHQERNYVPYPDVPCPRLFEMILAGWDWDS